MIVRSLAVGPIKTNCYLLCDEESGSCAIIDPGADAPRIAAAVAESGCTPCAMLLTHGHFDHTGAVSQLRELWPETPVYLNSRDHTEDKRLWELFPPVEGALSYDEGDTVAVGGLSVSVLATPGHSLGGVTLLCDRALFCGDTLFALSCGRTDFPGGSMDTLLNSLSRLNRLEGDFTVYPGHMGQTTLERERQSNPYLHQGMDR